MSGAYTADFNVRVASGIVIHQPSRDEEGWLRPLTDNDRGPCGRHREAGGGSHSFRSHAQDCCH